MTGVLKGRGGLGTHRHTGRKPYDTRQRDESDTAISQERSAQDCLQPPEAGEKRGTDTLPHNRQKKPTLRIS